MSESPFDRRYRMTRLTVDNAGAAAASHRIAITQAHHDDRARTFLDRRRLGGDVIAEVADKGKFDLLMMGSHGHGTLGKLVLGEGAVPTLQLMGS